MDTTATDRSAAMPDEFDRLRGALDGVSSHVGPATRIVAGLFGIGGDKSYIIETYRQRDDLGDGKTGKPRDTVFIRIDGLKLALPPLVTMVIAQQRDTLSTRERKQSAKRAAATRKARRLTTGAPKR